MHSAYTFSQYNMILCVCVFKKEEDEICERQPLTLFISLRAASASRLVTFPPYQLGSKPSMHYTKTSALYIISSSFSFCSDKHVLDIIVVEAQM